MFQSAATRTDIVYLIFRFASMICLKYNFACVERTCLYYVNKRLRNLKEQSSMNNSYTSATMETKRRAKTEKSPSPASSKNKTKKNNYNKNKTKTENKKTKEMKTKLNNTNPNFINGIMRRTLSGFKNNLYLVKL